MGAGGLAVVEPSIRWASRFGVKADALGPVDDGAWTCEDECVGALADAIDRLDVRDGRNERRRRGDRVLSRFDGGVGARSERAGGVGIEPLGDLAWVGNHIGPGRGAVRIRLGDSRDRERGICCKATVLQKVSIFKFAKGRLIFVFFNLLA